MSRSQVKRGRMEVQADGKFATNSILLANTCRRFSKRCFYLLIHPCSFCQSLRGYNKYGQQLSTLACNIIYIYIPLQKADKMPKIVFSITIYSKITYFIVFVVPIHMVFPLKLVSTHLSQHSVSQLWSFPLRQGYSMSLQKKSSTPHQILIWKCVRFFPKLSNVFL